MYINELQQIWPDLTLAAPGQPTCGEDCRGYGCTRPPGHKGPHVATGAVNVYAIAAQGEPTGIDAILAEYTRPRLYTNECLRQLGKHFGRHPKDQANAYRTLQQFRSGQLGKHEVLALYAPPKTSEELLDEILAKFADPRMAMHEAMDLLTKHFGRKANDAWALDQAIRAYHKHNSWNNRQAIIDCFKVDPFKGLIWVEVPDSVFMQCQAPSGACHPCKEKHDPKKGRWLAPMTLAPQGYMFMSPGISPCAHYRYLPKGVENLRLVPIT